MEKLEIWSGMLTVTVRKMKRTAVLSFIGLLLIVIGLLNLVNALPSTTVDLTIEPEGYNGSVLPVLESDTIDVKVDSNIPVDIYVINYEQLINFQSDDFEYEKKWEGETSLNVNYEVNDLETIYYILIMNPSETETANVKLEYKLFEEVAKEAAEDAFQDACCGGTVIVGLVLLAAMVAIGIYTKRRD